MNRRKPSAGVQLRESLTIDEVVRRADPPPPPGPPEPKKGPGRCTGHCCRSFCLRSSPAELAKVLTNPHAREEDRFTASMVIPLGRFASNPTQLVKGESWAEKALHLGLKSDEQIQELRADTRHGSYLRENSGGHYYACRYVLLNGDCGIYENRPEMCRSYPNGHECAFEACTMPEEEQTKLIEASRLSRRRHP